MIIPSINCKDFGCIKSRLKIASEFSEWVHIDISDGKFTLQNFAGQNLGGLTPHVSWNNPEEISNLKSQISNLKIEVHLMVVDTESQIEAWLKAGAKRIIVHLEAMKDSTFILEICKKYGAECFLAINPGTEVEKLFPYLNSFDGVLTLGVLPGPSGQEMKPKVIEKIKFLREKDPNLIIEIDGGVNLETVKQAKDAGANIFVAGAYIFSSNEPSESYKELHQVVL